MEPDALGCFTVNTLNHGYEVGDIVRFHQGRGWLDLWQLLKHPRIHYITAVNGNCLNVAQRRMTWAEFRAALWFRITEIGSRYRYHIKNYFSSLVDKLKTWA